MNMHGLFTQTKHCAPTLSLQPGTSYVPQPSWPRLSTSTIYHLFLPRIHQEYFDSYFWSVTFSISRAGIGQFSSIELKYWEKLKIWAGERQEEEVFLVCCTRLYPFPFWRSNAKHTRSSQGHWSAGPFGGNYSSFSAVSPTATAAFSTWNCLLSEIFHCWYGRDAITHMPMPTAFSCCAGILLRAHWDSQQSQETNEKSLPFQYRSPCALTLAPVCTMEGQLDFSPQHPPSEEPTVIGLSPSAASAHQHMSKACRASTNHHPLLSRGTPAEPLQVWSDQTLIALCHHHHLQTSNPHFHGTGRAGPLIAS